jgi:hypothetical protein
MENYSDSDTSSESEFDSIQGSIAKSDNDESQDNESQDYKSQDLEPELSKYYDEYKNVPWNPDAQYKLNWTLSNWLNCMLKSKPRLKY